MGNTAFLGFEFAIVIVFSRNFDLISFNIKDLIILTLRFNYIT